MAWFIARAVHKQKYCILLGANDVHHVSKFVFRNNLVTIILEINEHNQNHSTECETVLYFRFKNYKGVKLTTLSFDNSLIRALDQSYDNQDNQSQIFHLGFWLCFFGLWPNNETWMETELHSTNTGRWLPKQHSLSGWIGERKFVRNFEALHFRLCGTWWQSVPFFIETCQDILVTETA